MSKTIYFVWQNPFCQGNNPVWQKISGQEFYALTHSDGVKGRFFVRLPSLDEGGNDCELVMEATECEYIRWKRENDHARYLRRNNPGYCVVSYHSFETEDGEVCGEELIADPDVDIEADIIRSGVMEKLKAALDTLSPEEFELISFLFLGEEAKSEYDCAAVLGLPRMTVRNRKIRILKKIKNFLES